MLLSRISTTDWRGPMRQREGVGEPFSTASPGSIRTLWWLDANKKSSPEPTPDALRVLGLQGHLGKVLGWLQGL